RPMSSAPSSTNCRRSARGMARWSGSMSRVEPSWWPKPGMTATPRKQAGSTHGMHGQLATEAGSTNRARGQLAATAGSTNGAHEKLAAEIARAGRDQRAVASGERGGDCPDHQFFTSYVVVLSRGTLLRPS